MNYPPHPYYGYPGGMPPLPAAHASEDYERSEREESQLDEGVERDQGSSYVQDDNSSVVSRPAKTGRSAGIRD